MWPEEKPITALVRQNCTGFCWGDLKAHRVTMSLLPTAGHHIHSAHQTPLPFHAAILMPTPVLGLAAPAVASDRLFFKEPPTS